MFIASGGMAPPLFAWTVSGSGLSAVHRIGWTAGSVGPRTRLGVVDAAR
jgi:hypothetical protein